MPLLVDKHVTKSSLNHIQRGCTGLLLCKGIIRTGRIGRPFSRPHHLYRPMFNAISQLASELWLMQLDVQIAKNENFFEK